MPTTRRFLFLQGPHGPFFGQLAAGLRAAGADTWRAGFNRGDEAFWPDRASYIACPGKLADWPAALTDLLERLSTTDIVLYGDTRPVHARAVAVARKAGLAVHVFEEGYLRPWWVTYERGGTNGQSRLMEMDVSAMRRDLDGAGGTLHEAPAHWGDMRQHIVWGARYHAFVLLGNRAYPGFRPHRDLGVAAEFRLHLKRLVLMPWHWAGRVRATRTIRRGGFPYHLALLQLEHD